MWLQPVKLVSLEVTKANTIARKIVEQALPCHVGKQASEAGLSDFAASGRTKTY